MKDFRDLALPVVEGILSRGKVPLLVGGSDYYLQAVVSRSLFDDYHQKSIAVGAPVQKKPGNGEGEVEGEVEGEGRARVRVSGSTATVVEEEGDCEDNDDEDDADNEEDGPRVQRMRRDDSVIDPAAGSAMVAEETAKEETAKAAAAAAHARLREVDPASAAKLHPHNTRRVRRSACVLHLPRHPPTGHIYHTQVGL